jgi:glucose-1-phosphate cytidylyltransferase
MKLVILAGGQGTRISEESDVRPKPLIEIGGIPIILHIMNMYAAHGVTEFIICAGYKGYMIKEYFSNLLLHQSDLRIDFSTGEVTHLNPLQLDWKVSVVDTGTDSMTGGRLGRVKNLVGEETFCMTYGDGVSDIDISAELAFHKAHGLQATLAAVVPPGRFGALQLNGDLVERFIEKPHGGEGLINGGFFVLEPTVLDLIKGDETIWERFPLETLAGNNQLASFRHQGFWHPMDTLRDKLVLEKHWAEGAPWRNWP